MILYLKGFESFFSTKKPNLINHFLQEGNLFNNTKKKECFSIRKYYDFCRKRLNKIQIDINGVLLVAAHHQKRVKTVNLQKYIFIYKILGNLTKNEKKNTSMCDWISLKKLDQFRKFFHSEDFGICCKILKDFWVCATSIESPFFWKQSFVNFLQKIGLINQKMVFNEIILLQFAISFEFIYLKFNRFEYNDSIERFDWKNH